MEEVVRKTGISGKISNAGSISEADIAAASMLLPDVVVKAKKQLSGYFEQYQENMNPLLDKEVDKLIELQRRHHEYVQLTLFDNERKRSEQERRVDELFDQFVNWVRDTLSIQNNPCIRIVTVLMGV